MTVSQLEKALKILHIPSRLYDIDISCRGLGDSCVCLRKEDGTWSVFTSERGQRFDVMQYKFESDACKEVIKMLLDGMRYL